MAEKKQKQRKRGEVGQAWSDLFAENEVRKKDGKKPWSDDELRQKMQAKFPDKAEKTTITRVSMIRSIYNKGTNLFAKQGEAGQRGRPVSHAYNPEPQKQEQKKPEPKAKAKSAGKSKPEAKPAPSAPAPKPKLVLRFPGK